MTFWVSLFTLIHEHRQHFPNFVLACQLHNTVVWHPALLLLTCPISSWRKLRLCFSWWWTYVWCFLRHISGNFLRSFRLRPYRFRRYEFEQFQYCVTNILNGLNLTNMQFNQKSFYVSFLLIYRLHILRHL